MTAPKLGSLLVLTEDSGDDGHATIVAVMKRMLQLLVPDCQTQMIGFEPKDEQAQRAVQGTGWKSSDPRHQADLTTAWRTIATKLGRENGFVFFHIDGDRKWTQYASSENVKKFDAIVVSRVDRVLRALMGCTEDDAKMRLRRLIPIVPFYSIEAWLYQHTDVAIRLCMKYHKGRHVGQFKEWRQDRAALDEVEKPKESVCLKSAHNLECAGSGYPAQEVLAAGCSYAACVRRLEACAELKAVLDATAGRGRGVGEPGAA